MPSQLVIRNRQRVCRIDARRFQAIVRTLLKELLLLEEFELCFHLVDDEEMAAVNESFLQHSGTTDVITFNYASPEMKGRLYGEVFICLNEAVRFARQFRTSWPSELVRYAVHAVLHLRGYDDLEPAARRRMKREENRLHRLLARQFQFSTLERSPSRNSKPGTRNSS